MHCNALFHPARINITGEVEMRFIFRIFCRYLFTVQTLDIDRFYNLLYNLNFLCGLDGNASVTLRNNILFECLMAFSFIYVSVY